MVETILSTVFSVFCTIMLDVSILDFEADGTCTLMVETFAFLTLFVVLTSKFMVVRLELAEVVMLLLDDNVGSVVVILFVEVLIAGVTNGFRVKMECRFVVDVVMRSLRVPRRVAHFVLFLEVLL